MISANHDQRIPAELKEAFVFYKKGFIEGFGDARRGLYLRTMPRRIVQSNGLMAVWQLGLIKGYYFKSCNYLHRQIEDCFISEARNVCDILKLPHNSL